MDLLHGTHFISSNLVFSQIWRFSKQFMPSKPRVSWDMPRLYRSTVNACLHEKRQKQLVFMGSPNVAANVLDMLLDSSQASDSIFEVVAVVTQPPSGRVRGKKQIPSPVAQRALDRNFRTDRIFTPERAGEETFLADLRALKPDLCVTAAYGNILPKRFLELPHHGSHILLRELPSILNGSAALRAQEQDDSLASLAPKVSVEESWLCFDQPALMLHNKVRAFAGWPGTRTKVQICGGGDENQVMELKIVTTKVGANCSANTGSDIILDQDALIFPCGGGSTLEVLEVQPPSKKVMIARAFWNGLRGRRLLKV